MTPVPQKVAQDDSRSLIHVALLSFYMRPPTKLPIRLYGLRILFRKQAGRSFVTQRSFTSLSQLTEGIAADMGKDKPSFQLKTPKGTKDCKSTQGTIFSVNLISH